MKKQLTPTELWHISAEALHTEEYRRVYSSAIDFIIKDKDLSILDTACGSGFPTADLINLGYKNIEASDADETSVSELKENFNKIGINIPIHAGKWQELASKISKKFDIVINSDNSFVYMDGWMGEELIGNKEKAFEKMQVVLKNFYDALKPGGMAIIGLGKHYLPNNDSIFQRTFNLKKDGDDFVIVWSSVLNWETRIHNWTTTVTSSTSEGTCHKNSYLLTKDELAEQARKTGFKTVHVLEPDGARDNLIVAIK